MAYMTISTFLSQNSPFPLRKHTESQENDGQAEILLAPKAPKKMAISLKHWKGRRGGVHEGSTVGND